MIAEIFSDLVEGKLRHSGKEAGQEGYLDVADLAPVFEKMELPVPEEEVDIQKTREGGYNLFLNPYGAVLRIYPSSKDVQTTQEMLEDAPDNLRAVREMYFEELKLMHEQGVLSDKALEEMNRENLRTTQIYHPDALPAIGRVQFDEFAVQLMPGKVLVDIEDIEGDVAAARIGRDTKNTEFHEFWRDNYTKGEDGHAVLIDTVHDFNTDAYLGYSSRRADKSKDTLLEATIKASEAYEALQQSFIAAWSGEKSFAEFWGEMKQAKEEGLLAAGWNEARNEFGEEHKAKIPETASHYEARILAAEVT